MATADCTARREREDRTIARALRILEKRAKYRIKGANYVSSPDDVRHFLRLRLNDLEREEFWTVWLDARNCVIEAECMFVGSLTQTTVYPREVVRRALHHNAASVIFAHNHPSGACVPSEADKVLTAKLKTALDLVDVQTLDHMIVGNAPIPLSFAENGLL
jgi:DNA repair protein RadC